MSLAHPRPGPPRVDFHAERMLAVPVTCGDTAGATFHLKAWPLFLHAREISDMDISSAPATVSPEKFLLSLGTHVGLSRCLSTLGPEGVLYQRCPPTWGPVPSMHPGPH